RAQKPIARGEWQHVAITYDGSSTAAGLRIYLSGQALATDVLRDHLKKRSTLPNYGTGHLTLGQRFRDRGFKDGDIDELRVYDRVLSPIEITNCHDAKPLASALAAPKSHHDELEAYYLSAVDDDARKALGRLREARRQF